MKANNTEQTSETLDEILEVAQGSDGCFCCGTADATTCANEAKQAIIAWKDAAVVEARMELVSKEFEGAWGITNLKQLSECLDHSENAGDVEECADALAAIVKELTMASHKEKGQ